MKKIIILPMFLMLLVLTFSCETKQSTGREWIETDTIGIDKGNTRYGVCGAATTDSILQLFTDAGDTLTLDITSASANGRIFGQLNVGDQLAVTVNKVNTGAEQVINLTWLMGDWVTPNTLDGSGYVGLTFHEGGQMDGIMQTDLEYKSWRIFNGKLLIISVTKDISEIEQIDTFQMQSLSRDSMIIVSQGYEYRYGRRSTMSEDFMGITDDDDDTDYDYE